MRYIKYTMWDPKDKDFEDNGEFEDDDDWDDNEDFDDED